MPGSKADALKEIRDTALYPALCSAKELGTRLLREDRNAALRAGHPAGNLPSPPSPGKNILLTFPFIDSPTTFHQLFF